MSPANAKAVMISIHINSCILATSFTTQTTFPTTLTAVCVLKFQLNGLYPFSPLIDILMRHLFHVVTSLGNLLLSRTRFNPVMMLMLMTMLVIGH
jgi:hypothetical protein